MNAAADLLRPHIERRPDRVAYYCGINSLTYAQLGRAVQAWASRLRHASIEPGSRVVIALPDSLSAIATMLGSMWAGLCAVPVNPGLPIDAVLWMAGDCDAAAVIVSPGDVGAYAGRVGHVWGADDASLMGRLDTDPGDIEPFEADREALALMLYTSGTTGQPKGVPHRHADITFVADHYALAVLGLTDADVMCSTSKVFFAYGFGNSVAFPLRAGAAAVLLPGKPGTAEVLAAVEHHSPTVFCSVPGLYRMLLTGEADLGAFRSVRVAVSAGEALPAATLEDWTRATGVEILDGIGSTEALHIFISNRRGRVRAGTSGELVPPYEARLVSDAGVDVRPGEPGHLLIRGESVARAYWRRPDRTAATMLADGWVRTGDVYVESDGYFRHLGRSDDMFKVDAQWISPVEVEAVLLKHPAVADCAVVPSPLMGTTCVCAHVVLRAGWEASFDTTAELRRFCLGEVPRHAAPSRVVFTDALPRTPTGKMQRVALRGDEDLSVVPLQS